MVACAYWIDSASGTPKTPLPIWLYKEHVDGNTWLAIQCKESYASIKTESVGDWCRSIASGSWMDREQEEQRQVLHTDYWNLHRLETTCFWICRSDLFPPRAQCFSLRCRKHTRDNDVGWRHVVWMWKGSLTTATQKGNQPTPSASRDCTQVLRTTHRDRHIHTTLYGSSIYAIWIWHPSSLNMLKKPFLQPCSLPSWLSFTHQA